MSEDWIDRELRADARRALPDDGFTERVMGALPRAPLAPTWLKPALILGSTALGSALAAILSPVGATIMQGQLHTAIAMGVVLTVCGCVLALDE